MGYNVFSEKDIRKAILNKADPEITSKKSKHWVGKIYVDGEFFGSVKIPNAHNKDFTGSKPKNLAGQLGLNDQEYNLFFKCKMKRDKYLEILKKHVKK